MLRRYNVYKDWKPYETWHETKENTNIVLHNYLAKEGKLDKKEEHDETKEKKEVQEEKIEEKPGE